MGGTCSEAWRWKPRQGRGAWALLALLALVAWSMPSSPTLGRTASTPELMASPTPGSLPALLGLVPAGAASPDQMGVIVSYADLVGQLAAVDGPIDNIIPRAHLLLPPVVARYGAEPLRDAFGFDLTQFDQGLRFGEGPSETAILRGRFDHEALRGAWQRLGYRVTRDDRSGVTRASFEASPDLVSNDPVASEALGRMAQAAILADGTLVFSASPRTIEAVVAAAARSRPALAGQPDVGLLLEAMGSDLASAVLVDGTALRGAPEGAPLAPVRLALLGVTPGGPIHWPGSAPVETPVPPDQPRARFRIALLFSTASDASLAVPVIEDRLATHESIRRGVPFADLFPAADREVRVLPDVPVVVVDLGFAADAPLSLWAELLIQRDLGFVAW